MPKFVFMPPQDDERRMFAARLADTMADYDVVSLRLTRRHWKKYATLTRLMAGSRRTL